MNVYGQPPAILEVSKLKKLLEKLGVEHTYEKVEAAVIVGQHGEQRRFLFAQRSQVQFVVGSEVGKARQVEC